MTQNGDHETIRKEILEWLTYITAIGGALAAIFGVFFPGDEAKRVAFLIAIPFVMTLVVVIYLRRQRVERPKCVELPGGKVVLRGLLPFEEGDELPERSQDVRDLYTLVTSSTFRFGVLRGESGCGKTSLLCAGLVPALRKDGFLPFYIPRPTKEPQEAIRAALTKELVDLANRGNEDLGELLSAVTPKGKKVVVILDQFEEFFLTNRTPRSRASFTKWLGESVANHNLPIAFLVGIQDKCFAKLLDLGSIPEPTSRRTTCELQSFEADRAKEILRRAAETDGVPFEPTLIEEVVKDLKQDEFVRPAELQIVGQQLRRERIFTKSKYVMAGYAEGILSSYISDEIEQSANRQVALNALERPHDQRSKCRDERYIIESSKSYTMFALELSRMNLCWEELMRFF